MVARICVFATVFLVVTSDTDNSSSSLFEQVTLDELKHPDVTKVRFVSDPSFNDNFGLEVAMGVRLIFVVGMVRQGIALFVAVHVDVAVVLVGMNSDSLFPEDRFMIGIESTGVFEI